MTNRRFQNLSTIMLVTLALLASFAATAAEKIGIFELVHESTVSFDDTLTAITTALEDSEFVVHAVHDVRVPDNQQRASVVVLTSPAYVQAAAGESPRTLSAQVLRVAVYTSGDDQRTRINMANPIAHAMVYYAKSANYDALLTAASTAATDLRAAISSTVPGESLSVQQSPMRTEKHYRKYKGDGPARMMAKFRTFQKSQLLIAESSSDRFDSTIAALTESMASIEVADSSETSGWEEVVRIPFSDDAVFLGITNPYIEDKMIRINSRFRKDNKTDSAPFPGVDHVAALPAEVLVIREDDKTRVLQYGQMWRMQMYFWDSGYRAFTANVGVPSAIAKSIDKLFADVVN